MGRAKRRRKKRQRARIEAQQDLILAKLSENFAAAIGTVVENIKKAFEQLRKAQAP